MRTATLMIAMSLDGYIADRQRSVAWLPEEQEEGSGSYEDFIRGIDTVVMARNTYHQVVTELSPGRWPYAGLECWVATHRNVPPRPGIRFFSGDLARQVRELKGQEGRGIWICGGAGVARQMLEADLVDCLDISVVPVLLGGGVRLFSESERPMPLQLQAAAAAAGGMARLVFRRA